MFTKKLVVGFFLLLLLIALPTTPKATSLADATPLDNHFVLGTVVYYNNNQPNNITIRMDTHTGQTWFYAPGTIQTNGGTQKVTGWFSIPEGGLPPKP